MPYAFLTQFLLPLVLKESNFKEFVMKDSQPDKMNHNLAIIALVLAVTGVVFSWLGPWFILPSLLAAWFAWQAINKEPERYNGKLFVYASVGLNLLLLLLFAALYLG